VIRELDGRKKGAFGAARILDAADPRRAVGLAARAVQVPAGLHQEGSDAGLLQHVRSAVDDVALGYPAEPDFVCFG
jgi:hypothetical protein